MIHILYGPDDYEMRRALREIRERLRAGDDMLESNTTVLDGRTVTPQELLAHATATPFLSANRLVVVEGLLGVLSGQTKGRGRKKKSAEDDPLEPWRPVAEQLGDPAGMPETTTLVFVDGSLGNNKAALNLFAKSAEVRKCDPLNVKDGTVAQWISKQAKDRGVSMDGRATALLATMVGPDRWALEREIEKLGTYTQGAPIDEKIVSQVATADPDATSWDLSGAVVAGDERKALTSLGRLLDDGQPPPLLSSMIVREYRQIALLKQARENGVGSDKELSAITGIVEWRLRHVKPQADRMSWPDIRRAYRLMLDADLSVKRGLQDDESSLQLLVHELCALARKTAGARYPAARPSRPASASRPSSR